MVIFPLAPGLWILFSYFVIVQCTWCWHNVIPTT